MLDPVDRRADDQADLDDVLTRLSVSLMDPTGFGYNEYDKIRSTIKELMKEAS